jgi:hypothetical protein
MRIIPAETGNGTPYLFIYLSIYLFICHFANIYACVFQHFISYWEGERVYTVGSG